MVAATSGADKENQNYEEIKKDLTTLSQEEQMDFVYRYSSLECAAKNCESFQKRLMSW